MRGRSECSTARQAWSTSLGWARASDAMMGPLYLLGDVGHRLEVAGGAGGEPGLDDVHVHLLKLTGDLHLLGAGHPDACRLLAVAEGGVQEKHFVVSHLFLFLNILSEFVAWDACAANCGDQKGSAGPRSPPHPARPGPACDGELHSTSPAA